MITLIPCVALADFNAGPYYTNYGGAFEVISQTSSAVWERARASWPSESTGAIYTNHGVHVWTIFNQIEWLALREHKQYVKTILDARHWVTNGTDLAGSTNPFPARLVYHEDGVETNFISFGTGFTPFVFDAVSVEAKVGAPTNYLDYTPGFGFKGSEWGWKYMDDILAEITIYFDAGIYEDPEYLAGGQDVRDDCHYGNEDIWTSAVAFTEARWDDAISVPGYQSGGSYYPLIIVQSENNTIEDGTNDWYALAFGKAYAAPASSDVAEDFAHDVAVYRIGFPGGTIFWVDEPCFYDVTIGAFNAQGEDVSQSYALFQSWANSFDTGYGAGTWPTNSAYSDYPVYYGDPPAYGTSGGGGVTMLAGWLINFGVTNGFEYVTPQ